MLTPEETATLQRWVRAGTTECRLAERARQVLLAAQGQATAAIARMLRTRPARVAK